MCIYIKYHVGLYIYIWLINYRRMIDDIDDLDLVNTVSMEKWYLKFRRFSLLYCRIIYNGACPFYGQETWDKLQ